MTYIIPRECFQSYNYVFFLKDDYVPSKYILVTWLCMQSSFMYNSSIISADTKENVSLCHYLVYIIQILCLTIQTITHFRILRFYLNMFSSATDGFILHNSYII